ncbi:GNAT family N-acetyltransferase [Burkholderia sp. FERM BP-3421]|uniref:GNAT family N-acetyltransferase n=1 Tax=Burkholderia sp. FERM BP-3421 TaxID=1494466 RepID=UPI002361D9DD|nr:GNAT family N-acetyltransferase [Burkholderia sp. FERM BP-3421]WDD92933.1 GNAT family N-acetyltransferase [Burkholderia sp. FERM BP-3421]
MATPTEAAPFTCRRATAADALRLGALAIQVFLDTYAPDGIRDDLAREALTVYAPERFAALFDSPSVELIVAERGPCLLDFAQFAHGCDVPGQGNAVGTELERLYVQRPFKGAGIGSALLARAEARAADSGASLWLTAWSGNLPARTFYAARGYAEIGITHYVFGGNACENRVFAKPLADGGR